MKTKKILYILITALIINSILIYELLNEKEVGLEKKIVTKIVDGDTIVVEGGQKVRLIGIDCDERGERCYNEAKNRLKELVWEKVVFLESESEKKDVYNRDLRYIFLDEKNINAAMIEEGLCVARFESKSKYMEKIKYAEKSAIEKKKGCKWDS